MIARRSGTTMTISALKNIFSKVIKANKKRGKLVGFIGSIPIYANVKVPEGEFWIKSSKEFIKITISDMPKRKRLKRIK